MSRPRIATLDYAQAKGAGEPECIGGFIPLETVYAFEPVPAAVPGDQAHHVLVPGKHLGRIPVRATGCRVLRLSPRRGPGGSGLEVRRRRSYPEFPRPLAGHLPRLDARE